MRLYTRWLNLSQNLLLDVTNLRLFFLCEYKLTFKLCKIWSFLFSMHRKKNLQNRRYLLFPLFILEFAIMWGRTYKLNKKFSRIIEEIDFYPKNEIADKSQKKFLSAQKKNTYLIILIKEQHIWVSLKNKFVSRMDRLNWDGKHPEISWFKISSDF